MKILVLGATGYVGGRLVCKLLESGYRVRAASRSIKKLKTRLWANHPDVELCAVDVMDLEQLKTETQDIDVVYYLVHSMNPSHKDFVKTDRLAAENLVAATESNHVGRIIYLGGLGEETPTLSKHLRSRMEVGQILQDGQVPVTILRAGVILGSGSASFEILRYLVERLPVMITPRWVETPCQPIAIVNVLTYLEECLENLETVGRTFDIGGPDVINYRLLMQTYAKVAGLNRRFIIPVPVFSPKLSSYWISLITPVPAYIARPLAEGLKNPVICKNHDIETLIPQKLYTCEEAIAKALDRVKQHQVETHWTDAGVVADPELVNPGDPQWAGGTGYQDQKEILVKATPEALWEPIIQLGGENGYYSMNFLWQLRGLLDLLFGGYGYGRGRRHPYEIKVGDALDCWRVVEVDRPKELLLKAEMKLPGLAMMRFHLEEISPGVTKLTQSAYFAPRGLVGMMYWWLVTPLHHLVFTSMLKGIVKASGKAISLQAS